MNQQLGAMAGVLRQVTCDGAHARGRNMSVQQLQHKHPRIETSIRVICAINKLNLGKKINKINKIYLLNSVKTYKNYVYSRRCHMFLNTYDLGL